MVFIRYLYIKSGLDIGWFLECFSLSSVSFCTRQIFSVLFNTIYHPVEGPSALYMDNTGNPSSSNATNSTSSGNQNVRGPNPLTNEELKEFRRKIGLTTRRIGNTCQSIDSKIENLDQGYSEYKYDSLQWSLRELKRAQDQRNTLFGDVYARNGDADALGQTQYPNSVHTTIRKAESCLERHRR